MVYYEFRKEKYNFRYLEVDRIFKTENGKQNFHTGRVDFLKESTRVVWIELDKFHVF